jgi:phospholipid-transporting ATPase
MDGPSFTYFDENDNQQKQFLLELGKRCRSVIGCRLTPIQKQQIVGLVRRESQPKSITLAIGDGANDVSMIREANIGIGIYGKEGRQAANSADVAIGQFKFLRNLMLVHGRWNYSRQSRAFLYCMHKNMVITLVLYWYSYFTALSGTSPFESWVYTGFNFILGLPIIFYGIMDKDISKKFVLSFPHVYSTGKDNTFLSVSSIVIWILNACLYAIVLSLLFYYAIGPTFEDFSLYPFGTTVFVGMCNALQLKVMLLNHQWEWVRVFMMVLSVGGMLLYLNILSSYVESDNYYVMYQLYNVTPNNSVFWTFGFFFVPIFVVFIDVFGNALKVLFRPSKEILYFESEHLKDFNNDPIVSKSLSCLQSTGGANNSAVSDLDRDRSPSKDIEMDKIYNNANQVAQRGV